MKCQTENVLLTASAIVLDIEGTTTSISFVKDVLFPYIRKHVEEYVENFWGSALCDEIVQSLRCQAKEDEANKMEGVVTIPETGEREILMKIVIENVFWQMDYDRKTKGLKDLQGLVMEDGYKRGHLKGHVYDDVEPCLKAWNEHGKSVYIYSSGSVFAQKLLFGHSVKGDLLPLIRGHFDTNVGMKGDPLSYKKISQEISCCPSETVFFTDVPKEARAAKEAGMVAVLLCREGNAPLSDNDVTEFPVINSFEEINFSKVKKVDSNNYVPNTNKEVSSLYFTLTVN